MILFQILQTNFQVKFSGSSNNMFSRLLSNDLYHRIRFGQSLQSFNQLGKISRILGFNCNSNDRRDGELHNLEVVGSLVGGEGTRLEQELVNTDKTENVTSGNIVDGLDEPRLVEAVERMRLGIRQTIAQMPSQSDYIRANCAAI